LTYVIPKDILDMRKKEGKIYYSAQPQFTQISVE